MSIDDARRKAYELNLIDKDSELKSSTRKNKRFMIQFNGKWIHFGAPYDTLTYGTFLDHDNLYLKQNWRARHRKIMKNGEPAYLNRNSPEYYSWHILW